MYPDRVLEADYEPDDNPASANGEPGPSQDDQSVQTTAASSTPPVSAAAAAAAGAAAQPADDCVQISNPLAIPGVAAYAQDMLDSNIHVAAWPYLHPLHEQLDNPFVQSDGKKPPWAVTNRTDGRVEAAHKDAKHTQGSSGPAKLVTFLQSAFQAAKGATHRWHLELQRLRRLQQTARRIDSMARTEAAWLQSEEAWKYVPPGPQLGTAAALSAQLLPAARAALAAGLSAAGTSCGVSSSAAAAAAAGASSSAAAAAAGGGASSSAAVAAAAGGGGSSSVAVAAAAAGGGGASSSAAAAAAAAAAAGISSSAAGEAACGSYVGSTATPLRQQHGSSEANAAASSNGAGGNNPVYSMAEPGG